MVSSSCILQYIHSTRSGLPNKESQTGLVYFKTRKKRIKGFSQRVKQPVISLFCYCSSPSPDSGHHTFEGNTVAAVEHSAVNENVFKREQEAVLHGMEGNHCLQSGRFSYEGPNNLLILQAYAVGLERYFKVNLMPS